MTIRRINMCDFTSDNTEDNEDIIITTYDEESDN